VVGFAAETDNVVANGKAKLASKGCDLMVVNEVGEHRTFDAEDNSATILGSDGSSTVVPEGSKEALGHAVWDLVVSRLAF
jgi:phosphopantothenoylcysteine decarboxylase/phosphopantothenate--cysteine ligase